MDMEELIKRLELLRQQLPDPFRMKEDNGKFYNDPNAKALIEEGQESADAILQYLGGSPQPSLTVPAILLLAALDPGLFYDRLIAVLKNTSRPVTEAFEHGFWLIKKDEEQLASDLISIVVQNPAVLLLLQRPVVKKYKAQLQQWIEGNNKEMALYAMYCYKYALDNDDINRIKKIYEATAFPEVKQLAATYLEKLAAGD